MTFTADVRKTFTLVEQYLKKSIKYSSWDASCVRDAFVSLAVIHLLLKNEKKCQIYSKQAHYAIKRVACKGEQDILQSLVPSLSMIKWKYPNMEKDISFTCDQCDRKKSGNETLKKCPCKNGYYCSDECQSQHWPIHKDVCFMRKSKKLEFDCPLLPQRRFN